jgi:hypothetical protein
MSWTIGKITISQAPNKVAKKSIATLKKVPYLVEYPWLMSMGADVTELQVEGEVMEDINETLYTTQFHTLEDYVNQPMTVDETLLDDSVGIGTALWTGHGVTAATNTGAQHVKFENSVFVDWNGGTISRSFGTGANKDFSKHNLVSIWMKGTVGTYKVTFYNELYGSKANGYRFYPESAAAWTQTAIAKSSSDGTPHLSNVGTPIGWNKINCIVIEPSTGDGGSVFIDSFYMGHGWILSSPGTRYDGIYAINTFEFDESEGEVRSLAYKMTLMEKTPFFGEV